MSEQITRQRLIQIIKKAEKEADADHRHDYAQAYVADAILAELQPSSEWVSVKDRLPEVGEYNVAADTDYGKKVTACELNKDGNWIHDGEETFCHSYYFEVTHWMPLPEPPKEKDSEES